VRGFGYMYVEMSGWSLIYTTVSGELENVFIKAYFLICKGKFTVFIWT
jgi:hypothetical protein